MLSLTAAWTLSLLLFGVLSPCPVLVLTAAWTLSLPPLAVLPSRLVLCGTESWVECVLEFGRTKCGAILSALSM